MNAVATAPSGIATTSNYQLCNVGDVGGSVEKYDLYTEAMM